MAGRDSYKTTLFDREGPDAGIKIKAWSYAMLAGGVTMGGIGLAGVIAGMVGPGLIIAMLVAPPVVTVTVAKMALRGMDHVQSGVNKVLTGGSSTPYSEGYSYQQSLVMRGRLDEALESYEAIIADENSVDVRIRAAELYVREAKNHQRAVELLQDVIRHPQCTPGEEIYAANRLADLLSNHLGQPGKALVQLRRIADRYTGTPVGERAREAIRTLKAMQRTDD
jgi:hypothetical protein